MNASMELIYRRAAEGTDPALPRELEDIVRAGFVRSGDRLYLVRPEHISPTPEEFDDFDAEGWVKKLHLDTETPPSDPSWRVESLQHGLTVAKRLMPQAVLRNRSWSSQRPVHQ